MTAFSRGCLRWSSSTPSFVTPFIHPFIHRTNLSRNTILSIVSSQRAFSNSSQKCQGPPRPARGKATVSSKLEQMKAEMAEHQVKVAKANALRATIRKGAVAPTKQAKAPKYDKEYEAYHAEIAKERNERKERQLTNLTNPLIRNDGEETHFEGKIKSYAAERLFRDMNINLYERKLRMWPLSTACLVVFLSGAGILVGEAGFLAEGIAHDAGLASFVYIAYASIFALAAFSMWQGMMRRSKVIKSIILKPSQNQKRQKYYVAHVEGTGFLPWQKMSTTVPIWDLKTSKPLCSMARETEKKLPDLRSYYGIQQMFVWPWRQLMRVWKELVNVFAPIGSTRSSMVRLWTEDNQTRAFSSWYLDKRAVMFRGERGFDWFVPSAREPTSLWSKFTGGRD
ncbi:hypothetical protein BT63DRAFT_263220 [Microthyrium microscopicum]|uniref:Uncharacterized protein n=1 Tax=Microthyrium microscopicum TaxID=703497 RepID=A0A6A6UF58_9PEZI|nr:hypothetical protein BT63DRAFT_263220 [Microthyrium microscopicum]